MFGIVEQPCARQSGDRREWMTHLCGLCLTLRDRHGQVSRITTNRDAVVLSALYEAQVGEVVRSRAAPCPLRHFRGAEVVDSAGAGVRFAAAVTLLLASIAVEDKVADGELRPAVLRGPADRWGARWRRDALQDAAEVGFDGGAIVDLAGRQAGLEATPGLPFTDYSAPTEESVGAAFRHTAVLAGRPSNEEALEGAGRMFGRIAYVLDAWEDRDSDRRHGRFNPFDASSPAEDAAELFRAAHGRLRRHLDRLELRRPALVRSLLVDGLHRAAKRVLADKSDRPDRPPTWLTAVLGGWAASVGACGMCVVCIHGVEKACEDACDEVCDEACSGCDCSGCDCDCSGCDCNCDGCDCSGCDCNC